MNTRLLSQPVNWIIVFLMLAIGGMAVLYLDKALNLPALPEPQL